MDLLHKLSGNNDMAVGMVGQDCLEDNGWLNAASTIVSMTR